MASVCLTKRCLASLYDVAPISHTYDSDKLEIRLVKGWIFLSIAIVGEVIATSALKSSEGFSRLAPSVLVLAGYSLAFYFLSLTLQFIPVGVAYAAWAGLGIVLVAAIAWLIHGQKLDMWAFVGIGLILSGVAVLNVLSKTSAH